MIDGFLNRIRGLLFSPSAEFDRIGSAPSAILPLLKRYLIPLALLMPVATILGMNAFDVAWDVTHGYRIPKERIFNIGVANFAFEVLTVLVIGVIFFAMMHAERRPTSLARAMNVAVFGAVPLMLSGALMFVPMNVTVCMAALIHTLYLYWVGVQKVMQVHPLNASLFVALSMTIVFGASTLMGAMASKLGLI
jgi:hypothetical protein